MEERFIYIALHYNITIAFKIYFNYSVINKTFLKNKTILILIKLNFIFKKL